VPRYGQTGAPTATATDSAAPAATATATRPVPGTTGDHSEREESAPAEGADGDAPSGGGGRRARRPDRPLLSGPLPWHAAERARARATATLGAFAQERRATVDEVLALVSPVGCLCAMMALYVLVFGQLTWAQQSNFGTFGYDMGIYDQAIWLLSRFRRPFDTVRGLHYFGFHVNVISFALVPFYWLGAGPHFLYLIETLALAAGAVPIWLLARDRLGNDWLALAPAAAYLLFPSVEWINFWHFHPEALAITPLLFAWWFASRRNWVWFGVACGIAMTTKEDAALAVAAMGVAVAFRYGRRAGSWAVATGLAWFVVCTKVVIPHYDGGQAAFYSDFFPTLGHSLPQVLGTIVRHPSRVYRVMANKDRHTYYIQLLAPVAFLPVIGGWAAALVAVPQLVVNTVGAIGYAHDIRFHYSALVVVGVMLATVESLGARAHRFGTRAALVAVLLASALAANVAWSPSPISVHFHNGEWAVPSAESRAEAHAVAQVRDGAGVSASYTIVPHLTHRVHIYEWPNPFQTGNWGIADRNPDPPSNVQWLVVDTNLNGDTAPLLAHLTTGSGPFRVTFRDGPVIVAHRGG
jgi:uncharacterized membrane protein